MVIIDNFDYKDVTDEWLKRDKTINNDIIIDDYYIDNSNVKHPIKELETAQKAKKYVDEYDIALFLSNKFGGDIHLVPRITDISNTGIGTSTPDYIWNGEKWDLKTPTSFGKINNSIERFVKNKKSKKQAENFIINFKKMNITNKTIIELLKITLKNPYRK